MRTKIIIILLCLIIPGSASFAGSIIKVFEFHDPIIEKTGEFAVISFKGTRLLGEPGKATIPFFPVKLLLPQGEIATSIRVEYEKPIVMQGQFDLLPRQRTQPISEEKDNEWLVDQKFYRSDISYPSSFSPEVETHFMNGYAIALSVFPPLRYNPSKKEVAYYQRIIVIIETARDPEWPEHKPYFIPSEKKAGEVANIIQNPEVIPQYFTGREYLTDSYDYLIITANQYLSEFDTLIAFYEPRGIRTKATSKEYIASTTAGIDLQQKIRNYIIEEYLQYGIEYVLIGGDKEVVPYRGFYCQVFSGGDTLTDSGIPADLYYSALDGTWNDDGDGLWGENTEDDLYPEVGIGRMTFSDTAELHNMLHKTILFQSNPVEGELTKPLLAGEHLWSNPATWGSDYLNLLVGNRTDNGYSTHGIPSQHPRDTLYDKYATWTKAVLMNHINSGRPWLHHVGHASYTYVMKMYNSDITNANFSLTNGIDHNFTIVYTHGCMCGGFDQTDCIAEKMVGIDNFAVAFIGNSRYGWFNQGTTDGPSEHLHREFVDALYDDSLYHIGMAHLSSKSETAPFVDVAGEFEPGATRWCFYDNNLLGDPMMAVWTEEPHQIDAVYPELIPIGDDFVTVHLDGLEGFYHNFTCSLYRNDTLFGTALTNTSGTAVIPMQGEIAEGPPVWLIVTGYNILPHYYAIEVCDYWLGVTSDWNDRCNWFSGAVPDTSSSVVIPADPQGDQFPVSNNSDARRCKSILIETGAQIIIGEGESFSVGDD